MARSLAPQPRAVLPRVEHSLACAGLLFVGRLGTFSFGGETPRVRVSRFRGLLRSTFAPTAQLARLRLANPPSSISRIRWRGTCGDGEAPTPAPQVVQGFSPAAKS